METVQIYSLAGLTAAVKAVIRAGQMEAAQVWNLCKDLHLHARNNREKWPLRGDLQRATKDKQFALHSQSVQMVCHAFLANVVTTTQVKKQNPKMRYPYKDKVFYPLLWPAQALAVYEKRIVLPMGRGRKSLVLARPDGFPDESGASKIVWNGRGYELHVATKAVVADKAPGENRATVDLGQIHLAAVTTDTGKGLIVSGRGIRSQKRELAKQLGQIARKRSRCETGSRRWRKLQGARGKVSLAAERKIRDMRHKATRQVVDFCAAEKVGTVFVGDPKGVRQHKCGRQHNQRISQWEYGIDKRYLQEKSQKAAIVCFTGSERGTSSRCPECGHRHKPKGRSWDCKKCGFHGHRDLVGSVNMHWLAYGTTVKFPSLRDTTYLRPGRGSPWQIAVNEDPAMGSSSRPDTGQLACLAVAAVGQFSQPTGLPVSRQRVGKIFVSSSEARPL